jgi:hypothetical protein
VSFGYCYPGGPDAADPSFVISLGLLWKRMEKDGEVIDD